MMKPISVDHPLLRLFHQLRRRGFLLGPDDLLALHRMLGEGYGWSSRTALRDLCRALWAKSRDERVVLDALFDQLVAERWSVAPERPPPMSSLQPGSPPEPAEPALDDDIPRAAEGRQLGPEVVSSPGRLPPIHLAAALLSSAPLVLVPQHPVSFRSAAHAWRRLRRPVRFGPPIELDLDATIARRARAGIVTPPVLRPRRRNTARVILLVDRDGSMVPFHDFVAEVARAIQQHGQLASSACFYFHDVPAESTNDAALARLPRDTVYPAVDVVAAELLPAHHGWIHHDPELLQPAPFADVVRSCSAHAVVVISDAGAARGRYDAVRILDSLAFVTALRAAGASCVWMNPLPPSRWRSTSAGEIARHLAMFPLDRDGMHQAVNHLRGHPMTVRPV